MATTIDQQFVEYIVKSLVGKPDAVKVERRIDERGVLLELTVDPEDLGRVIGKRGSTAQSIRTLLRALGTKNDARYNLKIVDNGEPQARTRRDDAPKKVDKPAADDNDDSKAADDTTNDTDNTDDEITDSTTTDDSNDLDMNDEDDLPETASEEPSDLASRTRKELEDLDDLDV